MSKHTFEIKEQILLDGQPFQIISGSIHYFRVVPEYWRDRLVKLRAMGCNTVETYVPWNLHEPQKGRFDFQGMLDLGRFLKTAQEVGLWAIVRPSPYICAELEFGGLPAWLLAEDGMKLRCTYPPFLSHVRSYYERLFTILSPLQIGRGGNILMMQVENEYGAYGDETAYLSALRDMMEDCGATVPLITSDGPWGDYLACGSLPGALATANFGSKAEEQLGVLSRHTDGPLMCMEFWVGWFDAWGDEKHHTTSPEESAKDLDTILSKGSVNIYMFHGGTSFGLTNGANYYGKLTPDTTSYDYDAPLSEDGQVTPKYRAFQQVIAKYAGEPKAQLPPPVRREAYGAARVQKRVSLFSVLDDLPASVTSPWPLCMEKLGQSYGYTLYRSKLDPELPVEKLQLQRANDRAQVFFDQKLLFTLFDKELLEEYPVIPALHGRREISILTENLGRVNYGPNLESQRKGIDGAVLINGHGHSGWEMFPLPMDAALCEAVDFEKEYLPGTPSFYLIPFQVDDPADTFLELDGWGKGCVLVNGFNAGRFWETGPQKRLYIPAPLLQKGENRLIVFESEGRAAQTVRFYDEPSLG